MTRPVIIYIEDPSRNFNIIYHQQCYDNVIFFLVELKHTFEKNQNVHAYFFSQQQLPFVMYYHVSIGRTYSPARLLKIQFQYQRNKNCNL